MAERSQRTSSRRRSTAGSQSGSQGSGRTAGSKSSAAKRTRAAATRSRATSQSARKASPSAGSTTSASASQDGGGLKSAVMPVVTGVVGAAAGVLGGVVLGRKSKPKRKVLGVSIPVTGGGGIDGLAGQVGEAAKQFGRLAGEVRQTRERAEKIGRALS